MKVLRRTGWKTALVIGSMLVAGAAHPATASADLAQDDIVVGPSSSVLTVVPRGDAEADRVRENRSLRHSVLEPAGRYVSAGDELDVTLPAGASGITIVIGQYGPHLGVNGGADTPLSQNSVFDSSTTVVAPIDGLVYLRNSSAVPVRATVGGGIPVPMFRYGQTTQAEFQAAMVAFDDSPFVLLESDRVVAAVQRRIVEPAAASITEERIASWDDVVARTDEIYGLSTAESGIHRRSAARIYIANPDSGAGYASATHDRVTFQVNTSAGEHLLTAPYSDQWGLWHEIGHTYQAPQYRWSGLGEVTVNISSLVVQTGNGWPSRLNEANKKAAIDDFLAQPERSYDALTNVWVKLAMFDGLRTTYGDSFYMALNRQYREQAAAGLNLPNDDAKKLHFIRTAETVAPEDLDAYFQAWGLTGTDLSTGLEATVAGPLSRTVNYELTVKNLGPAVAETTSATFALPPQAASTSNVPSDCSVSDGVEAVTCGLGSIAVGTTVRRTIGVTFSTLSIGPLTATSQIDASTPPDRNPANDSASSTCMALTTLLIACDGP